MIGIFKHFMFMFSTILDIKPYYLSKKKKKKKKYTNKLGKIL